MKTLLKVPSCSVNLRVKPKVSTGRYTSYLTVWIIFFSPYQFLDEMLILMFTANLRTTAWVNLCSADLFYGPRTYNLWFLLTDSLSCSFFYWVPHITEKSSFPTSWCGSCADAHFLKSFKANTWLFIYHICGSTLKNRVGNQCFADTGTSHAHKHGSKCAAILA